jgi:hypothetical protein
MIKVMISLKKTHLFFSNNWNWANYFMKQMFIIILFAGAILANLIRNLSICWDIPFTIPGHKPLGYQLHQTPSNVTVDITSRD